MLLTSLIKKTYVHNQKMRASEMSSTRAKTAETNEVFDFGIQSTDYGPKLSTSGS